MVTMKDEEEVAPEAAVGGADDATNTNDNNKNDRPPLAPEAAVGADDAVKASSKDHNKNDGPPQPSSSYYMPSLSKYQWTQLGLLALCYALAFASVTLVMSEAPLVVLTTGGAKQIAPVSIAAFEIGKSFVVLPVGPMIIRYGRKKVFFLGGIFGLLSSMLGILGIVYSIPNLILVSTFCAGGATGIAYGYRFAAIEVSPANREFAVTLCLSGGIVAAIAGPVSAFQSVDWFDMQFLGTYVMNTAYVMALVIVIAFLKFPVDESPPTAGVEAGLETVPPEEELVIGATEEEKNKEAKPAELGILNNGFQQLQQIVEVTWTRIFINRVFVYACLLSIMSWVCMDLPLSAVGVAMQDAQISEDLRMTSFIMHFLGMFLPSLFSGHLIRRIGFCWVGVLSALIYAVGGVFNLLAPVEGATLWILGQFSVGVAWNLGFSSATVMLSTSCPPEDRKLTARIQAYNDFISFFCGGVVTISVGYIYDAGGGGLAGWRLINYFQFLFVGIMLVILFGAWRNGGSVASAVDDVELCDEETETDVVTDLKPWRQGTARTGPSASIYLGKGSFYSIQRSSRPVSSMRV